VLYVVQFTRWTNADYSNVVPALQPAVLPLRVARAQLAKLHRDERETRVGRQTCLRTGI
tara:strand:- start:190 stop:366 length:177 start_codon:yes stop_codon:yes gene_type:complete